MKEDAAKGLINIGTTSTNDIIVLLVVLILGLFILLPLFILWDKSKQKKRDQYMQQQKYQHEWEEKREKMYQDLTNKVIDVVDKNASIQSELMVMIKNNNNNCYECKVEQTGMMAQVLEKSEEVLQRIDKATAVLLERARLEATDI